MFHLATRVILCLLWTCTSANLHKNLFMDGHCLLFGNFLNDSTLIDSELFKDQVMVLTATRNIFDHLREFTSIDVLLSNFYRMQLIDAVSKFHGFVEDTIKDPNCIVLVHGSHNSMSAWLENIPKQVASSRHGRVSSLFYYPGMLDTRSSSSSLINRAWRT